jgi:polyphosphate kinase 2 (PPK2 family)
MCGLTRLVTALMHILMHIEFVNLQQWVVHKGLRVCILFEGRDGAGKGGTATARVPARIPSASACRWLQNHPSSRRA